MTSKKSTIETVIATSSPLLKLIFPSGEIAKPGQQLSLIDAIPEPTLYIKVNTTGLPALKKYIMIAIDPDAPFPSFPILGPILHGIQTDLHIAGAASADGWCTLESSSIAVFPWAKPGPPCLSAPHRYFFFVFEQPEGVTAESIKNEMGWGEEAEIGFKRRIRWDQGAVEKKLGLGRVVAGTWFICGKATKT